MTNRYPSQVMRSVHKAPIAEVRFAFDSDETLQRSETS
jgi:hypothetical protein